MRVAFVSSRTTHHEETDATDRRHALAADLAERGHDVVFLTARWWEGDHDAFEHESIEYRGLAPNPGNWRFALRLPGALRAFDPDVIHADCEPESHPIAATVGGAIVGAPVVLECYDPPTAVGPVTGRLTRVAARAATAVVTPSRTVRTRVREMGVPGDDVTVVPTGIEMDVVRDVEPADGGDIVYSRRLDQSANLETLLLALAEFREYDWRATIVGDGPERGNYERQARDLRIEDRVDFVGERSVPERIALFKSAHVYVHTAEYTPFAIDLLRALAAGAVGIVEYHAESSAHELVERRERGFTATSAQELTERLAEAGALDRRTVDEEYAEYDRRSFVERYLELYRDAIH